MSKKRNHRRFKNEDEERDFWATQDSTDFVDWTKAQRATLPDLKPSVKTISLRLPQAMYDQLKALANKHHVPYQSLIKLFLAERIRRELERDAA
jgi:predicted DNA binding CopG/RHH family protein